MKWQYAITTCCERAYYYDGLLASAHSLHSAGFEYAPLSMNCRHGDIHSPSVFGNGFSTYRQVTPTYSHDVRVGAFGNWLLTAWELYLSNPHADRYAIFQDDIRASKNLKAYLEACPLPPKCYQNLCLYPKNHIAESRGWYDAPSELGLGAQGLVFSNEAMQVLLASKYLVQHPKLPHGKAGIDGVVHSVMQWSGYSELVHYPSLIKHVNGESTLGHPPQPESVDFMGEDFDLMTLLETTDVH